MSKLAKLNQVLTASIKDKTARMVLFVAQVKSIEGESCTIVLDGLEIDEVRLKATINGAANKVIMQPKPGTMAIVGSLDGTLRDLAIITADEVEKLTYQQDGLIIEVDSGDGRVSVRNSDTSLAALFLQLTEILNGFKVFTASGVSGGPIPATTTAINAFKTNFKKLLK